VINDLYFPDAFYTCTGECASAYFKHCCNSIFRLFNKMWKWHASLGKLQWCYCRPRSLIALVFATMPTHTCTSHSQFNNLALLIGLHCWVQRVPVLRLLCTVADFSINAVLFCLSGLLCKISSWYGSKKSLSHVPSVKWVSFPVILYN